MRTKNAFLMMCWIIAVIAILLVVRTEAQMKEWGLSGSEDRGTHENQASRVSSDIASVDQPGQRLED